MLVKLSVEVHCIQPRWIQNENSRYRVYLNDELMTERDWSWDQNTFINEHITAELFPAVTYTIRVESIKTTASAIAQFGLDNLIVAGTHKEGTVEQKDILSFTI